MNKIHTLQITTPEGIVFSLNLAGPVTRFLAYAIDLACIAVATTILHRLLVGLLFEISPDVSVGMTIAGSFLIQVGYGIGLEWGWRGQTLGKRLMRLRVMDVQGLHLQFGQIVIRNLFRFVDSLPVFYLLGGLTCLLSRRAQRLGDFAANTIVIRSVAVPEPDLTQLFADKFNSLREYPHLAARLRQRVNPQEAGVALQALLRRNHFEPQARLELFAQLASHLKTIVEFPQEAFDGISDEQYVRNVVDVLFRTQSE